MGLIGYIKKRRYEKIVKKYLEKYKAIKGYGEDTRILCNCERWVRTEEIVYIHPVNVNYFDWWSYELLDKNNRKDGEWKTKIRINKKHKPYAYIGYVPILKEIPYYLHKWFAKKDYALSIECKYCCDDED